MALDPQKIRACAPLLPDEEYRRRRRTTLAILIDLFTLCYGQWAARRAHAYADQLDGRAT